MTDARLVAALALLLSAAAAGCGVGRPGAPIPAGEGISSAPSPEIPEPRPVRAEREVTDRVEFRTSMGTFVIGLYGNDAPDTVRNFLSYVDRGFYSNKVFHRVIPGFMIQGGGFDPALEKAETDPPIPLEIIPGLKHELGVVSMARTDDPHSATSQFFVCVAAAVQLNGGYAAFGKVEEGIDVVVDISSVMTQSATAPSGAEMGDVPVNPVVIEYAKRLGGSREGAGTDAGTP